MIIILLESSFSDDEDSMAEVNDFNTCVNAIQVSDMNIKGFFFTWNNKRGGSASK